MGQEVEEDMRVVEQMFMILHLVKILILINHHGLVAAVVLLIVDTLVNIHTIYLQMMALVTIIKR